MDTVVDLCMLLKFPLLVQTMLITTLVWHHHLLQGEIHQIMSTKMAKEPGTAVV
jgi:hypothetical protein